MFYPQYDEIEDTYPNTLLSMACLNYVYQTFSNCFDKIYRCSPLTIDPYLSDSESLIDEETFFNQMQ
jgi:hypothetical protein